MMSWEIRPWVILKILTGVENAPMQRRSGGLDIVPSLLSVGHLTRFQTRNPGYDGTAYRI